MSAVANPNRDDAGCDCLVGLQHCLFNVFRALGMGSWLGIERPDTEIPGRMISNGSSEVVSMFSKKGTRHWTTQDAMISWENFGSRPDTIFCGVFDGHGERGELVSNQVRDSLPLKLIADLEINKIHDEEINQNQVGCPNSEESFFTAAEESMPCLEAEENMFQTLTGSFLKSFELVDSELKTHEDISYSNGTTAVTLLKQGQDLVIGNLGDSRAILATKDENDKLVPVQLIVDHKPNLVGETERIRKCNGRVEKQHIADSEARVWLPRIDYPGLAMTRAFGDFCVKNYGVISVPDISFRRLTERDMFVVLASDGIWDVMSNKDVVDEVASSPARSNAAQRLVESAVKAWQDIYGSSYADDCAAVCIFLDSTTSNISTAFAAVCQEQAEDHSGNNQDQEESKQSVLEA